MNKPPRITRAQIIECNWSWASVNQALAYRRSQQFLKLMGGNVPAESFMRGMMRYHATDAIRSARVFTPSKPYTP